MNRSCSAVHYLCTMSQTIDCKVGGMTCGNCALTITNYLSRQGASHAVANPATGEVHFTISDEQDKNTLLMGIESLGYPIEKDEEHTAHHQHASMEKKLFLFCFILWIPLMAHMVFSHPLLHEPWVQLALCTPVYLVGFFYFGRNAWRSLRNGIPNMDVLVFIGSTAAFIYSISGWYLFPEHAHQYLFFETTASIITLVLLGNLLEQFTVSSTAGAIRELVKIQKTKARLLLIDSLGKESIQEVENKYIRVNDLVLVNTGDQVPVDGEITLGQALIDESMLSGESIPVSKSVGEPVVGGSVVTDGNLRVRATAVGSKTVLSSIIRMVNEAQAAKPPMQKLADKISAIFVPLVIGIALLTFLVNFFIVHAGVEHSIMRSIAVMVVACPCAMGLATPAAVMVGLGRAARKGILIKGGDILENFRTIRQFVFDKTGTLTTGKLTIEAFHTTIEETHFKKMVAAIEHHSSHPIAKGICRLWGNSMDVTLTGIEEMKGIGIKASHDNETWEIGSFRILDQDQSAAGVHDLYVLKNKLLVGWIDIKDEVRPDARALIDQLKEKGYRTAMLSGDLDTKCRSVAAELGLEEIYSEKLPAQKLHILDELMKQHPVVMVGDGINDAPSLAKASIGVSLSDASQVANQTANVILVNNKLSMLPAAIGLGRQTYTTIKENLFWAFFYNVLAIPVAAAGYLTPTWAAGIMALSDVVLVLNSLRLGYKKIT